MKKWLLIGLSALVLIYLVVGFVLVPYLIESKAPEFTQKLTKGRLSIGSVSFNPLVFELELKDIVLADPDNRDFLTIKRLFVGVDPFELIKNSIHITNITIASLDVDISINADRSSSLDWLLLSSRSDTTDTNNNKTSSNFVVKIDQFLLDASKIKFSDYTNKEPLHITIDPLSLQFDNFDTSDLSSSKDIVSISAKSDNDELINITADLRSLDPVALSGELDITNLMLYNGWYFVQDMSSLEVADGRVGVKLSYDVDLSDLNATALNDLSASLSSLRIREKGSKHEVLSVKNIFLTRADILPLKQYARISKIAIDRVNAEAIRNKNGDLDWVGFIKESTDKNSSQSESNSTSITDVEIGQIVLHDANFIFTDRYLDEECITTIDSLDLNLSEVSTNQSRPITISSAHSHNRQGRLSTAGVIVQDPLDIRLQLDAKEFMLAPFSPYIEELSFMQIKSGKLSALSRVIYAPSSSAPDLSLEGDFALQDLLITDSRDNKRITSLDKLNSKETLFELDPSRLYVEHIDINGLYSAVRIDENRSLNLANLLKQEPNIDQNSTKIAKKDETDNSEPFPVMVVKLTLSNTEVDFSDYSLPLQFDTRVHGLKGDIIGISTQKSAKTRIKLDGIVDKYGVLKAVGTLKAGDITNDTDISLYFRNIDMSSFSPYSSKFIGQMIDQGRLDVKLGYKIKESNLRAENSLTIKKIVMGDDVKSDDAISLPIGLAIALLEDSDGVIEIDMPVRGDVDSPDFKWGGVVWNAFVNVLTKAVTAPFSFLGKMLGIDGDDLKTIEFEPAKPLIDPPSIERLDEVAKALNKRPKLALKITVGYDEVADTRALKIDALLQEVLLAKNKSDINASEDLETKLLEQIYIERFSEDNLTAFRDQNSTTVYIDRLTEQLIESQPLLDDALKRLCEERYMAIVEHLHRSNIDPNRISNNEAKAIVREKYFIKTELELDVKK